MLLAIPVLVFFDWMDISNIPYISDMTQLRKVDLLTKTDEGITPLHDAVLNNQIEVSRLLLQHGGMSLIFFRPFTVI